MEKKTAAKERKNVCHLECHLYGVHYKEVLVKKIGFNWHYKLTGANENEVVEANAEHIE